MSYKAQAWAWAQPTKKRDRPNGLKSPWKFVLVTLAENHNGDNGRCDVSVAYIADKTGLDRKTVMVATAALESLGLISVKRRFGTSDKYILHFDKGELVPKKSTTSTKNGTGKGPPTSTKNGTATSTKNGTGCGQNQYQKRDRLGEPVPNLGHEPNNSLSLNIKNLSNACARDDVEPVGIDAAPWRLGDYERLEVRYIRPDLFNRADLIAENFLDHHRSAGTVSCDWAAEWRKWLRRERAEFSELAGV